LHCKDALAELEGDGSNLMRFHRLNKTTAAHSEDEVCGGVSLCERPLAEGVSAELLFGHVRKPS